MLKFTCSFETEIILSDIIQVIVSEHGGYVKDPE